MILVDPSERKPGSHRDIPCDRCPHCGCEGTLRLHGAYRRLAVLLVGGAIQCLAMSICRVRCRRCGRTHALLPADLAAGTVVSVGVWMAVAMALRRSRRVPGQTAAALRLGASRLRRARRGFEEVARELGRSLEELEEALADADRAATELAASFARKRGTTPFSQLRLALVTEGAGSGDGGPPNT